MNFMTTRAFTSLLIYFLIFSLVSVFFLYLDSRKLLSPIHNAFDTIATPGKSTIYDVKRKLDDAFSFLTFWKNGTLKMTYLEQRVAELTVDSERMAALEKENVALRDQINATNPKTYTLIPARTIGFDRYLFIDRGEVDGVGVGMTVLSREILVGVVVASTPRTSKVLLPTDPDSKIPVKTARTGAKGILFGQFGSSVIMDKVVQSEELRLHDTVVTSGESNLPNGFVVGTIEKVERQETELFQKAEVKPLLNYARLEHVFVNASL